MPNSKNVAVLINSCDSYTDVLDYFFFFFKKFWNCPYKVYLNMENTKYHNRNFDFKTFSFGKTTWSNRLIKCLNAIKEEYVLMFLDDFFLLDFVNQEHFDKCLTLMEQDKNIGYIMFEPHFYNEFNLPPYNELLRIRNKYEDFLATTQIALWKKSYLLQVLRKRENPWDFEIYGSFRMRHYKQKCFVLNKDAPPIFPMILRGENSAGIISGQWQPGNVQLFEKYNLHCDFSKRGIVNLEQRYKPRKSVKQKYKELSVFKKIFLPFYDLKLFKSYYRPIIKKYINLIDLRGRLKNKLIK